MEFDSTGMALNNEQVISSRFPQRLRMMRSAQQTRAPFAQALMYAYPLQSDDAESVFFVGSSIMFLYG